MTTLTYPDVEGDVRTWTRALGIFPADAVYFGYPTTPGDVFAVLSRVGGGSDTGNTPLDYPRMSWSIYARTKKQAADASGSLRLAVDSIGPGLMGVSTYCYGAHVETSFWSPDPTTPLVRYIVDAVLTVRTA